MSQSKGRESGLSVDKFFELLSPTDVDKIEDRVEKQIQLEDKEKSRLGGSGGKMDGQDREKEEVKVRPGWKRDIDERVRDNTKTSRENKEILSVIDERTSILMRMVFAILVAMVVGVSVAAAVQLIFV